MADVAHRFNPEFERGGARGARHHRVGPAEGQPRLARPLVHAAGGGVPDPVPGLSARPRRLALLHRRPHRPHRRVHRPRELRMAVGRQSSSGSRCSTPCSIPASPASSNSRSGFISRCCSTSSLPFKAMHARRRADSVHRADRALGDRVLVALSTASSRSSPGRCGKLGLIISTNIDFLGDVWNARWSVIFANIWRGVPFVAITLLAGLQTVSPSLYEAATIDGATPLADVPLHHLSAAHPDHRRGDDLLGAVHLHRFPADLGA